MSSPSAHLFPNVQTEPEAWRGAAPAPTPHRDNRPHYRPRQELDVSNTLGALFHINHGMIRSLEIPMTHVASSSQYCTLCGRKGRHAARPRPCMCCMPTFVDAPLRPGGGCACRHDAASTRSLTLNPYDPVHRPSLLRLRTVDVLDSLRSSCSATNGARSFAPIYLPIYDETPTLWHPPTAQKLALSYK